MIKKKHWFTLIELLISMVVVCVLFVVLLSTYSWISRVWFKIEQEKNVYQEILQLTQLLQNISDNNDIDFDAYTADANNNLYNNSWLVDILYLSGKAGKIKIFSSWLCLNPDQIDAKVGFSWGYCSLYINDWDNEEQLVNNRTSNITKPYFKIIPFASEQKYIDDVSVLCPDNYLNCINKHWFWIFTNFYNWAYKKNIWELNVNIPLQLFYSFNF